MAKPTPILEWSGSPWGGSSIDAFLRCGMAAWEGHDIGTFKSPNLKMRFGSAVHRTVAHYFYTRDETVRAKTRKMVERGFDQWAQFSSFERPSVDWDNILGPGDPQLMGDLKLTEKKSIPAKQAAKKIIQFLKGQDFQPVAVEVPKVSKKEYNFSYFADGKMNEFSMPVTCTPDIIGVLNGERVLIDLKTTQVRGADDPRKWREDQLQSKQVAVQSIIAEEMNAKPLHLVANFSTAYGLLGIRFVEVEAPHVRKWLEDGVNAAYQVPMYNCTGCSNYIACWKLGEK